MLAIDWGVLVSLFVAEMVVLGPVLYLWESNLLRCYHADVVADMLLEVVLYRQRGSAEEPGG